MKPRMIAGLGLVIFGAIVLRSPVADAYRIACPSDDYDLNRTDATFNGQPAPIGSDRTYRDDGGLVLWSTPVGHLTATPDAGELCGQTTQQVVVRFVDPWSGETLTATLRGTP